MRNTAARLAALITPAADGNGHLLLALPMAIECMDSRTRSRNEFKPNIRTRFRNELRQIFALVPETS